MKMLSGVGKDLYLAARKHLPLELMEMIGSYIDSDLIWRYGAVMERAASLSLPQPNDGRKTIPLCDVLCWSRNDGVLVCDSLADMAQLMQVTIDCCGIQRIERISSREKLADCAPTTYQVFIVEYASKLGSVQACFEASCNLSTTGVALIMNSLDIAAFLSHSLSASLS